MPATAIHELNRPFGLRRAYAYAYVAAAYLAGTSSFAATQTATQPTAPNTGRSALGVVYSSANADAQSLIGIFNGTSSTDWNSSGQTVTLTLRDGSSGAVVGQWTSPSLKAGVAKQFPITEIEKGLSPGAAKPATYAITVQAAKVGMAVQQITVRHGVLSNATACDTGVATHGKALINVRGSVTAGDYPSTVVITNTDTKTSGLKIEIYDAEAGYFMGSFSTPAIPAGGAVMMSVDAMEAAARIRPNKYTPSYVIRFGRAFDGNYSFVGFLQNLVNNTRAGTVTDLTAYCPVGGPEADLRRVDGTMRTGPAFSSGNAGGQSAFQFANTSTAAGTVKVTLQDVTTGATFGTWTSPSIPAGAAQEFPISSIEGAVAVPAVKPSFYAVKVQSGFAGDIQHVLRGTVEPVPTDLSTCDFATGASLTQVSGVRSSQSAAFASTVVITNTGAAPAAASLGLYDADTGAKLGSGVTPSIPAGGHVLLSSAALEAAAQISPGASRYVVRTEGAFTGFLQHIVANAATNAGADATVSCKLQLPPAPDPGSNKPPPGATLADVPSNVDLRNLPAGIDLSGISQELRDYIASLMMN